MEAIPKHFLSSNYIIRENGKVLTELRVASWRERAEFETSAIRYELGRERVGGGEFMIKVDDRILARARKLSIFDGRFEVCLSGRSLELRKSLGGRPTFVLSEGSQDLGKIFQRGVYTRRPEIELPEELPSAERVFLFWLALVIWNREAG